MSDAGVPTGSTRKREEDVYDDARRKRHASGRDRYRRDERDRYEPPARRGWERRDRGDRYGGRGYRDDRRDRYAGYAEDRRREEGWGGRRGGSRSSGHRDERELSPSAVGTPPPGTQPIALHPRPNSGWDRPAPGWERVSAFAAKATGQFGAPGQPVWQVTTMPPPGLEALNDPLDLRTGQPRVVPQGLVTGPAPSALANALPPGAFAGGGITQENGLTPEQNRQSRRLYVGGITSDAVESELVQLFTNKLIELKLLVVPDPTLPTFSRNEGLYVDSPTPTLGAQLHPDRGYAFLEFRSPEEATNALAFDGILYQEQPLKVRRPKDYVGPQLTASAAIHVPGVVSTNVPDGPNKIYIGGLPSELNEDDVMSLLQSLGELRAFNLVREAGNGPSKGFAFCEYLDPAVTDTAIKSLNEVVLGERKLTVQLASLGANPRAMPTGPLLAPTAPPSFVGGGSAEAGEPTTCIQMLNMVTPDELKDDEEYADIVEDIRDECLRYGTVQDVRIPRPARESRGSAASSHVPGAAEREGVGRVYVKFATTDQCAAALKAIAGRQFGGRVVIAAFLAESDWPGTEDGGETTDATSRMAFGPRPDADTSDATEDVPQVPDHTSPPPPPPDEAPPAPEEEAPPAPEEEAPPAPEEEAPPAPEEAPPPVPDEASPPPVPEEAPPPPPDEAPPVPNDD